MLKEILIGLYKDYKNYQFTPKHIRDHLITYLWTGIKMTVDDYMERQNAKK